MSKVVTNALLQRTVANELQTRENRVDEMTKKKMQSKGNVEIIKQKLMTNPPVQLRRGKTFNAFHLDPCFISGKSGTMK